MSGRRPSEGSDVVEPTAPAPPSAQKHARPKSARARFPRRARTADRNGDRSSNGAGRRIVGSIGPRLARARRRVAEGFVHSLPGVAKALRALGVLALLFAIFVVVFGAMRHTTRQAHLDDAFRARVALGHADGPNWRPVPGQAIATISIPAIGVREVVVEDSTPQLLDGGPGHLLGTPLPGHTGNAVILGRRITDGAVFRNLGELSPGDAITVVTPQGAFAYSVRSVERVAPTRPDVLGSSTDARLTLLTAGSWFFSRDRLAVVATLQTTPSAPTATPEIQLRSDQLGGAGDSAAIVTGIPWAAVLVLVLLAWRRIRRGIRSRSARVLVAAPVLAVVLFFLFENAANLLPGTI